MDASSLLTMVASECACASCQSACTQKPGWFAPGEAEKAAEYLGLTLKEFFDNHLIVDTWFADLRSDNENVHVLSPAYTEVKSGDMAPAVNAGPCTFFKDGRCSIHPVKPLECRIYDHTVDRDVASENHAKIMELWQDHQKQITELLGKEPVPPKPTLLDTIKSF